MKDIAPFLYKQLLTCLLLLYICNSIFGSEGRILPFSCILMDLDKVLIIEFITLRSSWHTTVISQGQTFYLFPSNFSRVSCIHYSWLLWFVFLWLAISHSFISFAILLSRVRGLKYKKQQQRIDDILSAEL